MDDLRTRKAIVGTRSEALCDDALSVLGYWFLFSAAIAAMLAMSS
jgi:hypothetical protein